METARDQRVRVDRYIGVLAVDGNNLGTGQLEFMVNASVILADSINAHVAERDAVGQSCLPNSQLVWEFRGGDCECLRRDVNILGTILVREEDDRCGNEGQERA